MSSPPDGLVEHPNTVAELQANIEALRTPVQSLSDRPHIDRLTLARGNVDRLGRKTGHFLDISDYLLTMARMNPERVRRVPTGAVAEDGEDDDGDYALLICPCSARPIVRATIDKCSGCERYYVLIGPRVYVVYGEMPTPPLT